VTRAPAVLAFCALLSPTATAEPCAPRVELSGDRDAIARVAVELASLGVVLGAIEPQYRACSVNAMVTLDGEGLSVAVQNAAKRSEGRVVSDAKIAAAWIDSWLRDEIEVSSWTIAVPPPAPPSTLTTMPLAPIASAIETALPSATPGAPFERVGLGIAIERSWTDDDTEWDGFDIAGCMRVGLACIGGRVRAGFQQDLAYLSSTADRSDIVALATVSLPLTAGQVSLAPELGLGIGRMRTKRIEACTAPPSVPPSNGMPGCSDPMDPTCTMTPEPNTGTGNECLDAAGNPTNELYVGDDFDKVTYLPRLALAMRLSFPIVRHVWLDAVAAYTITPITPRGSYEDPDMMVSDPSTAMPPEPTRGYQLGVGIRVGMP
jgi:hypothetical protein